VLTNTAERLTMGNLDARAATPDAPQELHRLAQSFNEMAGRLQAHFTELRIFVANASHELRTPLTSIKLRVEALRSGALEDKQVAEQFLAEIESEVDRLSSMVNDLLDLSRIEAGLEKNQRQPVNLGTVLQEVYETFSARAQRAGIELNCEAGSSPTVVLGSEDQLRRMISNLVDNAIKYTRQGGNVDLILHKTPTNGAVRLVVRDNGFGISREHLPHIFERFYRVEATRPRYGPPQGSGLGLAIARSIVETHGGKIGVTSQLGKGSAFWVELPLENSKRN
jgi:signal transduction histidine kinase